MSLENVVTGGRATWLDLLAYDPTRGTIELRTFDSHAPESPRRHVLFAGVSEFAEEPFDLAQPRNPYVLDGLVGLDVHRRGSATWYAIHTDERAVTFYAEKEPIVELLDARG